MDGYEELSGAVRYLGSEDEPRVDLPKVRIVLHGNVFAYPRWVLLFPLHHVRGILIGGGAKVV